MKRIVLLLAIFTTLSGSLYAQIGLKGGIKLGANLSQLDGESWKGGYKANFLGGAFLGIRAALIGVQIEGLFVQSTFETGNKLKELPAQFFSNAYDSAKNGAFRVNSFSIPVLFQLKLFKGVWIQAGPQFSGIVSVKDKDQFFKDAKGLFSKGEVSGVGGLWLDLPFHLNAGARYTFAFSSLSSDEVEQSWKQKNLQIHVGYTF